MLVVAFYTRRTPYEQEVRKLEISAVRLGLKYHLEGYDSRGAWVYNCAIKPEFILEMLTRQDDDLLYVDADAEFMKEPTLIQEMSDGGIVDIAAHIMAGGILLSGTVYFRNNAKIKEFVNEWIKKQRSKPDRWDQKTLHETLINHGPRLGIEFAELPKEYCRIFDKKDWGDAVIKQNQKSIDFKEKVKDSIMDGVPAQVHKQRVTVHGDGSFTIPRRHREAEAYMDKHYRRVPGERRWFKTAHQGLSMEELRPIFHDKKCYIIGKGPSLDNLTEQAFDEPTAPIIAINESIHKVESLKIPNPIFALQQDMGLRDTCKPTRGKLLVSEHAQHWYAEYLNKYVYDYKELGVKQTQLSVICAIEIAKKYGVRSFDLICFDGCVTKNIAYAECVGHAPTGDPKRFLEHPKHIEKHVQGYKVNWVIPTADPSSASRGTRSLPLVHPVTHHALGRVVPSKKRPNMSSLSLQMELFPPETQHDHSSKQQHS